MAEQIASEIINKMISAAGKKIMFVIDLDSHLEKLRDLKTYIEVELKKTTDPFEIPTDAEGLRIEKLRGVNTMLHFLFDELAARRKVMDGSRITTKVRLFCSSSNQLVAPFKIARKINFIKSEIQTIATNCAQVSSKDIITSSSGNPNPGFNLGACPPLTDVVFGRNGDRDDIISLLRNGPESDSVGAIVGIGGQGKTTLAKYVCNDERVKACFDVLLWVYSSPYSSFSDIVKEIYPQFLRGNVRKKCLLVLDNIWYQQGNHMKADWLSLKHFLQGTGSKIVVTTRSMTIARIMDVRHPYELHNLPRSDAMLLFQHFAGQGQDPGAEVIKEEIIDLCPKVPLVLRNIGCHLAERDPAEWESFKNILASESAIQVDDEVLRTLKVSYDQLDEKLKLCAAYCSVFPRWKRRFGIDEMVLYWMALGFVESEDAGVECVHELNRLGIFERFISVSLNGYKNFELHDVMHDLITVIGKSKHQVIDSETKEITEGVWHVSWDTKEDPNGDVLLEKFKGKQLLQSILKVSSYGGNRGSGSLGSRIEKLISRFRHLKVLKLNEEGIEKVPTSIGKLIQLRHLDLSNNPFRKLPDTITQLVYLLSLKLLDCKNLQELPGNMRNLKTLRRLWVQGTKLCRMPKGIGNLGELRTLDMFVVEGYSKGSVGAKLEELGHLNNLKGRLTIRVSGQSKYVVSEAKKAQMQEKTGLTDLEIVFEKKGKEDEKFLEDLQPSGENLEDLKIRKYGGERLPTWMTDDGYDERFPRLYRMYLQCYESGEPTVPMVVGDFVFEMRVENNEEGLLEGVLGHSRLKEELKTGPMHLTFRMPRENRQPRGNRRLKSLRDLPPPSIKSFGINKKLAFRSGVGGQQFSLKSCFPNLRCLELTDIPELEVLPEELRALSSLKRLTIMKCPKLKEIPHWIDSFSSLQLLFIRETPQLTALPASIGNLTFFEMILLSGCPRLEPLQHQIIKFSQRRNLYLRGCSKALFGKCRKPTGEYWPFIQHVPLLGIGPIEEDICTL